MVPQTRNLTYTDEEPEANQGPVPRFTERYRFVDDLPTSRGRGTGFRKANVQSFVQSEYHRRQKIAAFCQITALEVFQVGLRGSGSIHHKGKFWKVSA
jgi:hypothetical protein